LIDLKYVYKKKKNSAGCEVNLRVISFKDHKLLAASHCLVSFPFVILFGQVCMYFVELRGVKEYRGEGRVEGRLPKMRKEM